MTERSPEFEAARLLSRQREIGTGVWVRELTFDIPIIFDTFENYSRVCRCESALPCEGCTVYSDGIYLVLYNSGWDVGRINYTLAHEVGHIILGHTGSPEDETEANRFASALTVPFAPLRALGTIDGRQVADFFGCSLSAATYALRRPQVVTPYDEAVTALFADRMGRRARNANPLDIPFEL